MLVKTIQWRGKVIPAGVIIGGFTKANSPLYVPEIHGEWRLGQATATSAVVLRGRPRAFAVVVSDLHDPTVEMKSDIGVASLEQARGVVLMPFEFDGVVEVWSKTNAENDPEIVWDQTAVKDAVQSSGGNYLSWATTRFILPEDVSHRSVLTQLDAELYDNIGLSRIASGVPYKVQGDPVIGLRTGTSSMPVKYPRYEAGSAAWEGAMVSVWNSMAMIMRIPAEASTLSDDDFQVDLAPTVDRSTFIASLGGAIRLMDHLATRGYTGAIYCDIMASSIPLNPSRGVTSAPILLSAHNMAFIANGTGLRACVNVSVREAATRHSSNLFEWPLGQGIPVALDVSPFEAFNEVAACIGSTGPGSPTLSPFSEGATDPVDMCYSSLGADATDCDLVLGATAYSPSDATWRFILTRGRFTYCRGVLSMGTLAAGMAEI